MKPESSTSVSLLLLLKDSEQLELGWSAFIGRYGPRIYQWCLNRNLQPSDAEDVTQNVLVKLAQRMQTFQYDPAQSFRGWLNRVTQNAVNDFFEERSRHPCRTSVANQNGPDHLDSVVAREDLLCQLKEAFDLELLEEAVCRVRNRVSGPRFRAWELAAKERLSGAEIGKQLDMPVASVYTAKNQVQKLIRQEIKLLEGSVH